LAGRHTKVISEENQYVQEGKMNQMLSGILIAAAILLTAQSPRVLTNQDILDMVTAKLSDSVIIAAIHKSPCKSPLIP